MDTDVQAHRDKRSRVPLSQNIPFHVLVESAEGGEKGEEKKDSGFPPASPTQKLSRSAFPPFPSRSLFEDVHTHATPHHTPENEKASSPTHTVVEGGRKRKKKSLASRVRPARLWLSE